MKAGQSVELSCYVRLGEHQVWTLIEEWQQSSDKVLADLASRLMQRRLFKTQDVDPMHHNELVRLKRIAKELVIKHLTHVSEETVDYYVAVDEPNRTSYRRYDWRSEEQDESIWMVGEGRRASPIEEDSRSKIVTALKDKLFEAASWRSLELAATALYVEREERVDDRSESIDRALRLKPQCVEFRKEAESILEQMTL